MLFLLSFFSLLGEIVSVVAGVDEDEVAVVFDPVAALSLFDAVAVSLVATLWEPPESKTKRNEY